MSKPIVIEAQPAVRAIQTAKPELPVGAIDLMLNLSTGHIPKSTADALDEAVKEKGNNDLYNCATFMAWEEYGWIFFVSDHGVQEFRDRGHPELANVINFANRRGFHWLRLDCDANLLGPEYGLPTFDW